jgi:drug/metabolite transporter (DMT)-like permease
MSQSKKKKTGRLQSLKRFAGSSTILPVVGEMIFSLLTMPLAYYFFRFLLDEVDSQPQTAFYLLIGVYICLGFRRMFKGLRLRERSRSDYVKYMIYGTAILAAAFFMLILGDGLAARIISGVYLLTLVADRVIACVNKPSISRIVLSLLVGFVLVSSFIELVPTEDIYLVEAVLALLGAILSTLSFVFGRIKVGVLKDIIRQTYAAEIVGGLLLLIFVFSFMLMLFEKNITSYGDALWYCFAIVTTIGFGDIAATSMLGRIMSVILGIYGIVVVALITSVIVAFYGEMKKESIGIKDDEEENPEEENLEEEVENLLDTVNKTHQKKKGEEN